MIGDAVGGLFGGGSKPKSQQKQHHHRPDPAAEHAKKMAMKAAMQKEA